MSGFSCFFFFRAIAAGALMLENWQPLISFPVKLAFLQALPKATSSISINVSMKIVTSSVNMTVTSL